MLSLIAWTVTRLESSTLALVAAVFQTLGNDTAIPWSIVSGALGSALGAGIAIGVLKSSVNTLTKSVDALSKAVSVEKAARIAESEKWNEAEMNTRERLARIETKQDSRPLRRDHESTTPRKRV